MVLVGSGIALLVWMIAYTILAEKQDSIISNATLIILYIAYQLR